MTEPRRQPGLAGWSIRHPVSVVMITLAIMVLGLFALSRLNVDLLPQIIYPEVRVRILDPGVPATIMEDQVTRQLEEQLAITEDAIHVQSRTTEGRSSVDLAFEYGKDIDIALRDASTRLDRAKRFLPDSIDPPVIYKRDPFQLPVAEYVVSSTLRDPVELRYWADYVLSRWLLNLPGVAAVEVGGGRNREIQVEADQDRLAGLGLDILDVAEAVKEGNRDTPAGRLLMPRGEFTGRTAGRFTSVDEIARLPIAVSRDDGESRLMPLEEVATVIDGAEDERLRIRYNDVPGVKISIQKQPTANTVNVMDAVSDELDSLESQGLLPPDIRVQKVDDQSIYIRHSLRNAIGAALTGALLAMLVVYVFLGNLRRTLLIGSAIPIAVLVTFILMSVGGLTLNIMTLGGLALGIGMLVDSTIVMLENIQRHQASGEPPDSAAANAAAEVNSAIVASTSTNLAAVLPFLFIGGLVGLLFRELIFTISAAIVASMLVALALVPALASRIRTSGRSALRRAVDLAVERMGNGYARLLGWSLKAPWMMIAAFIAISALTVPGLLAASRDAIFLPQLDEGRVSVSITADRGINVEVMDDITRRVESLIGEQPEVASLYTTVGGFVFGRSQFESPNRASITVQLVPANQREVSSEQWISRMRELIREANLVGIKVRLYTRGIRGIRFNRGEDDLSLRIKGPDLDTLQRVADDLVERLRSEVDGLRNLQHSNDEVNQELSVRVDRQRAARLGLTVADVGEAVRYALGGQTVTEFLDRDRSVDVLLRIDRRTIPSPADLDRVILFTRQGERRSVRLPEIAEVEITATPTTILRDRQQRVVEVSASLSEELTLRQAVSRALEVAGSMDLPRGYVVYEAGSLETLQEGERLGLVLLALAIFLVLVVMAVQYESLRNPLVILVSVPFAASGVALGLQWTGLPVSMPVWLGLIMLAGIVVNNAIVLVEYIEVQRDRGLSRLEAIVSAGRLRLRPILMATLTTVVGMMPLAMALGEGAEMLQPLAVTIVSGLLFSMLVSLLLVPSVYRYLGRA
jgi:multidrug efflux pump subunit AcrB